MTGRPLGLLVVLIVVAAPARAGDGLVALQTADPSCADDSGDRYVDCGNGTLTDNETGLVWLADADCFGELDWLGAKATVAGLSDLPDDGGLCGSLTPHECDCGLSDGSSPGEWRLPTIEEWVAMTEYAAEVLYCSPTVPNDAGTGCWSVGCIFVGQCSFVGVQSSRYWSSSSFVPDPAYAWTLELDFGHREINALATTSYVWPVRGGP